MKARYSAAARVEFLQAVAYLEERQEGVGRKFAIEVRQALREVVNHPLRWPKLTKSERWYRLNRFTYGLVYRVHPAEIEIVAVMHAHRKPGYWRRRRR